MKKLVVFYFLLLLTFRVYPQVKFERPLYGVAYYYEYMPYERLNEDVRMMKDAGISVVRVAESTWSVWEPHDGVFDFSQLDQVLDAMGKAGIKVIIGTPTYAMPAWLAKEHPEVLAVTPSGQNKYGPRQNMDITNPVFRFYAERIIRKLMAHCKDHPAVIGYQADNETKHYNTSGDNVQAMFVNYLKNKFITTDSMNRAFGLNYWSNSVHDWKDLPSTTGNINASLGCEFSRFQRNLVTDYLAWQVSIINEYKRPDQFVTHNFDFEWRGLSYGIQPDLDHFEAARPFDIAGIDIYHATADRLDGNEISFGGDLTRSMKQNNYLVMETQAQSISGRQELPYPGQLRLQAYSHLASGANMVEYWPWHSIHNALESYWKGVLSHDLLPNPTYDEIKTIGKDFQQIGDHLVDLKKKNKVAILFSNESLAALNWFPISSKLNYNDVLHRCYDALYEMNTGCDFVNPASDNLSQYSLLIVPPLYVASDNLLNKLNKYASEGGHIVFAFKSGFSDQNVKIRNDLMPGLLGEACGFSYQQFTNIDKLLLKGNNDLTGNPDYYVTDWAELIVPGTCKVLAYYDHPWWGKYAAITQNNFGKGSVTYLGAMPSKALLKKLLKDEVEASGAGSIDQLLAFPLIVKQGVNRLNKRIYYYFNYSAQENSFSYPYREAKDLLSGKTVNASQKITLKPWDFVILEELQVEGN